MRRYIVSLILCVACLMLPAYAQVTTGIIAGTVTDQTGAVAANVPVSVTNTATGATRTMNTSTAGDYRFEALPAGTYQLAVKAPNFKESVTNGVEVHAATTTTADVKLQVGSTTEHVDVEANAIQVQTDNASLGETVEGQQVRELPLNGRSFVQLTQLMPGVSAANNFDSKNKGLQAGVDFSVNGNATTTNLYLVDGANNNDTGSNRTILIYPSIESIAEFKMLRNSYGAEYGQAAGAVINIVTRSGSNDWHGTVLYSGRNTALDSRTWFAAQRTAVAEAAGQTLPHDGKDKLNRNDWGYSIGGPIIKNKLFFFWSQEWNHNISGSTKTGCVPTAAEAQGDFSQGVSCGEATPAIPAAYQAAGNPLKIANPDPAALLMVQKYPLPNQAYVNGSNWSASIPSPVMWRQENVRVDYNLSKNNTFMGRFTQDSWSNDAYNSGYWGEDPYPALNDNWIQPSKSIVGKWTRTIGTTMVNDAEFSYSNNRINITEGGINPNNGYLYGEALQSAISAAIPSQYPNSMKHSAASLPTLWGGLNAYGSYQNYWTIAPWNNTLDLYVAKDDASKVIGKHTLKFGALASWNGKNEDINASSIERPTFGSANWATSVPTNNDLANLMIPGANWSLSELSTNTRAQLRWHDDEFYVADNWKVNSRVTLDLGLRWSFLDAPYQPDNQITNFQPSLYNPALPASDACNGLWVVSGTDPCGAANAQYGTSFTSGTAGPGRALVNNSNHLIAPRVGVAWDPWGDGNTAIRAGFGTFYQRERVSRYTLVGNAPFAVTAGYTRALDADPSTATVNPGSAPAGGMDSRAVVPMSYQWNFSIQRSLARDTILELGYVGNHALFQTSSENINSIAPQNWTAASFMTAAQAQTAGFYAFNNYSSNLTWWAHKGSSTYNSLQALFKTRYKRSQLQAAYTWSHSIATPAGMTDDSSGGLGVGGGLLYPADPALDKGNSSINRPHIFTANFNYYLPDLNQSSTMVRGALGGWELGLITTEAMGNSISVFQNGLGENTNNLITSPNCLADPTCAPNDAYRGTLNSTFNTGWVGAERPMVVAGQGCAIRNGNTVLNQNAFTMVGYQIGTISPNMEPRGFCQGSSLLNTDLSIDKNFKLTERFRLQFRLDLFNAFNHANFRNDSGTLTGNPIQSVNCGAANASGLYMPCSPTNNVISSQTYSSGWGQSNAVVGNAGRQIQYGLHLTF